VVCRRGAWSTDMTSFVFWSGKTKRYENGAKGKRKKTILLIYICIHIIIRVVCVYGNIHGSFYRHVTVFVFVYLYWMSLDVYGYYRYCILTQVDQH